MRALYQSWVRSADGLGPLDLFPDKETGIELLFI